MRPANRHRRIEQRPLDVGKRDVPASLYVVGLDGSDRSWRAAAYAVGLAHRFNGRCRVVFVHVFPPTCRFAEVPQAVAELEAAYGRTACEVRTTLADSLRGAPVEWQYLRRTGDPSLALAQIATYLHADAVIIGSSAAWRLRLKRPIGVRLAKSPRWPVIVVP
jgi:nucleotide-binding universal stress UspA family protein